MVLAAGLRARRFGACLESLRICEARIALEVKLPAEARLGSARTANAAVASKAAAISPRPLRAEVGLVDSMLVCISRLVREAEYARSVRAAPYLARAHLRWSCQGL